MVLPILIGSIAKAGGHVAKTIHATHNLSAAPKHASTISHTTKIGAHKAPMNNTPTTKNNPKINKHNNQNRKHHQDQDQVRQKQKSKQLRQVAQISQDSLAYIPYSEPPVSTLTQQNSAQKELQRQEIDKYLESLENEYSSQKLNKMVSAINDEEIVPYQPTKENTRFEKQMEVLSNTYGQKELDKMISKFDERYPYYQKLQKIINKQMKQGSKKYKKQKKDELSFIEEQIKASKGKFLKQPKIMSQIF